MIKLFGFYLLIILFGCNTELEKMKYPDTKKEAIEERLFGELIEDPYRWLEDFTDESVISWVEKQNNFTNKFLENEFQKRIKKDLKDIWITEDISIPF